MLANTNTLFHFYNGLEHIIRGKDATFLHLHMTALRNIMKFTYRSSTRDNSWTTLSLLRITTWCTKKMMRSQKYFTNWRNGAYNPDS